jgi:hypothetical protein
MQFREKIPNPELQTSKKLQIPNPKNLGEDILAAI